MPVIVQGITSEQLGKSTAEWVRQATIDVAEKALVAEVSRGFDASPVVITDGRPRRDYNNVKPYGKIEFAARPQMAEIVFFAMAELYRLSPVKTGAYRRAHYITIDDTKVSGNLSDALCNAGPGARVQIINPQPYARKIEGATANKKTGRGKRRPLSRQAPRGVYRVVQTLILQKYGKTVFVDYKMVKLPELGVKVWGDEGGRYKSKTLRFFRRNQKPKRVLRDHVYPALQIFIKDESAILATPLN
jgi:hypothetical protein